MIRFSSIALGIRSMTVLLIMEHPNMTILYIQSSKTMTSFFIQLVQGHLRVMMMMLDLLHVQDSNRTMATFITVNYPLQLIRQGARQD